jgi:hypothetical protein
MLRSDRGDLNQRPVLNKRLSGFEVGQRASDDEVVVSVYENAYQVGYFAAGLAASGACGLKAFRISWDRSRRASFCFLWR